MDAKPIVFIGSSGEQKDVVRAINSLLNPDADTKRWYDGVFEPGGNTLQSLINLVQDADFAVLVLSGDDKVESRDSQKLAPRDNVLFELGLAFGQLGRERTFFVREEAKEIKVPSDLDGVTSLFYRPRKTGDLKDALAPACDTIRERLQRLSFRKKLDDTEMAVYQDTRAFCRAIEGHWWERLTSSGDISVGFLEILPDPQTNLVRLVNGCAYDAKGLCVANFRSRALSVRAEENAVFYIWEGFHPSKPNAIYHGFGEKRFKRTGRDVDSGRGHFLDANSESPQSVSTKHVTIHRCVEKDEAKIMLSNDSNRIRELVLAKLSN